MKQFGITYKNELIRMMNRKKLLTGIIVSAIIPILVVMTKVLALGWATAVINREDLFRVALSLFTPLILPLLAIALVSDAFTDEYSKGSLKTSLLLPDSRTGHFVAKVLSVFTGVSVMMTSLWTFSFIIGLVLPSRDEWILALGLGILQGAASLLPILVVIGFAVLSSQYIKSGSGMVLSLIGGALVMRLIPLWAGSLNKMLPTTWLGFGTNIAYLSFSGILFALTVMLSWTILTCGLAIMRFERRMV